MRPPVVALTGLSGVGKSTLLKVAVSHVPFQHLQASALIQRGREAALGQVVAQDHLRHSDLDENQAFLVRGLEASIDSTSKLVVLDSHTLIEQEVDPAVFAAIGICGMIFLMDEPKEIGKRRASDQSRKRPVKDVTALEDAQLQAMAQAEHICRCLEIPLHVEAPSNIHGVTKLLRQLQVGGTGA
jgi:adenylate kinase